MDPTEVGRFEATVLPHLDAAYTLARYLLHNEDDAKDVVQDAYLRALKYFGGFRGTSAGEGRPWLLTIVRNTAFSRRRRQSTGRSAHRRQCCGPCRQRCRLTCGGRSPVPAAPAAR